MKEKTKKRNIKKILLISSTSLVGIALVLIFGAYLIIHNYINRMNLVSPEDESEIIYDEEISDEDLYSDYEESFMNDNQNSSELAPDGGNNTSDTGSEGNSGEVGQNGEDPSVTETSGTSVTGEASDTSTAETSTTDTSAADKELKELNESVSKNLSDQSITLMQDKDVLNVLLIGTDARSTKERGRSDSMILVSINKKTKKIIATSFLRDIYLQIPGKENNRLNASYAYGGAKLLCETLEKNFKIKVDRYVKVDFFAFMDVVDAVGGVNIKVTKEELPYVNDGVKGMNSVLGLDINTDCLSEPGTYLLNGKQALSYARIRYVGTDFGRTARQRKIIEEIFNKVKGLSIIQIDKLLNKLLPMVTTNFKEDELFSQILSLPKYLKYDFDQWSIPVKGSYKDKWVGKRDVLGIDFETNIKELQKRVYNQ